MRNGTHHPLCQQSIDVAFIFMNEWIHSRPQMMRDLMNENEPKKIMEKMKKKKTIHTRIESIKTLRRNSGRE